jgi:hypothetical protein
MLELDRDVMGERKWDRPLHAQVYGVRLRRADRLFGPIAQRLGPLKQGGEVVPGYGGTTFSSGVRGFEPLQRLLELFPMVFPIANHAKPSSSPP